MPIHGYPGNVITANPVAPTSTVATGVWTMEQQLLARSAGNWPFTIPTQQISRSLRFNSADSAYLNRTPGSASNRKTFTWSGWVKRGALSSSASYFLFAAGSFAGSTNTSIRILNDSINIYWGGTGGPQWTATAVLRDPSAWYHLVFAFDTTQATFGNRLKLYLNGVQSTVWSLQETGGLTAQNSDLYINNNQQHNLGASGTPGNYFDGYMAEINFVDGQALTPSSFGQTNASTGVWEPINYTGTYGTNGFYLNFSDNSNTTAATLGKDYSGNGNNWTPNNFSVTAGAGNDSMVDSPTSYGTDTGVGGEVRGNYCTLNPLDNAQGATFSNGNLQAANATATDKYYRGTFGMSSGKWYWEIQLSTVGNRNALGITDTGLVYGTGGTSGNYALAVLGNQTASTTGTFSGTVPTFANGDYVTFAFDADSGILYFEKNAAPNTSTSPKFTGLSTTSTYFVTNRESGGTPGVNIFNFGQRAFQYTATSNYKALCTQNLPTPTIGATSTTQANDYFNAITYTGDGTASRYITGVGFQPDFVWIKNRTVANFHQLHDAVRGATAGMLSSNSTNAQDSAYPLTSFNADGFTTKSGAQDGTNNSGSAFVAWNWKANGAGSSNTAGTITSTVSASTTSGFSIVTYTGTGTAATVGHGLGVAPSMVIVKARSFGPSAWSVYTAMTGAGNELLLNSTAASAAAANAWNNTAPTSSVFTVGTGASVNQNTSTYVAYCFAPVAGYSAFGSYTGNGAADGPFVFTNFRPRYVMIKRTDSTSDWTIYDTSRSTYNQMNLALYANLSNAEGTTIIVIDTVSNGIKIRNSNADTNASGGTYIYAAFAESPFKYALAR